MRACEGRGYVYAQIGVDSTACPKNCRFCSFAAVNAPQDYDPANVEVPVGRIVHYAKLFDSEGVYLVSLMATAALDFDRYLDIVRAVRASVSDRMVIAANTGDLTLEQAQALKDAGANAAYHALRLGEGEWTGIAPVERRCTLRRLKAAGLDVMTGVEPVWQGADPLELSERICDRRSAWARTGCATSRVPTCTGASARSRGICATWALARAWCAASWFALGESAA